MIAALLAAAISREVSYVGADSDCLFGRNGNDRASGSSLAAHVMSRPRPDAVTEPLAAAVCVSVGAAVERGLFFAEARHVSILCYAAKTS